MTVNIAYLCGLGIVLSIIPRLGAEPSPVSRMRPAAFAPGDRWCVLGDSITNGLGMYQKNIELFYLTRFPNQTLEVINCGVGGG